MAERLWAPWRMSYIESPGDGGEANIFVDLPAQDDDRKNLILYRGRTAFVMLNRYPYTNGHLMVAPYRQVAEFAGLTDEEMLEIQRLLARSVEWIRRCYRPDGFNVGVNLGRAAGAGIPGHVHWHVVPRWSGDTNFMTTVGDVRVLPQDLCESYDRLREAARADENEGPA
ncbi:MAG: HIT domain-containing protein [Fimbriimonas ginsengisoli]|uniref:HIT domain-containing protein n=1 Tax=Fimbriimonas ginsengisoli TaxID=1005039 RepID=A0A931LYY8_FIMGI|nr:HIT domain-containing protein [Fimbriimonas ginsengisoli]